MRTKRQSVLMGTILLPWSVSDLAAWLHDEQGNKPFARWLDDLDHVAAAKVTIALTRMEQGNFSMAKSVGAGVYEYKIAFGPGYRIYFGRDGDRIVILIGGGTKKRQNKDIQPARECWADYKRRKKQENQEWL